MQADPIEQLAAELRELWQDSDLPSSELVAKLINVATKAMHDHMVTTHIVGECPNEFCMADICQRIREGMQK